MIAFSTVEIPWINKKLKAIAMINLKGQMAGAQLVELSSCCTVEVMAYFQAQMAMHENTGKKMTRLVSMTRTAWVRGLAREVKISTYTLPSVTSV